MNLLKILTKQVTSPGVDSAMNFILGIGCLVIAAIPPFGQRAATFAAGAAVSFFHCWRLRRKIAAAKISESHPDA